ncbi:MAG: LTA synthase family protein [Clostridia bacterium]|nr:LTA synthase family protein [Clostridia bacterium]
MTERKRRWPLLLGGFFWLIASFLLVVCPWYAGAFKVTFRELIYTLTTPMTGVGADIVADGVAACLPGILWWMLPYLLLAFLADYNRVTDILWQKLHGTIVRRVLRRVLPLLCAAMVIAGLVAAEQNTQFVEYLQSVSRQTTLYEDYYVDPKQVSVTPPKEKKNLICIYLESMETTYADEANGGHYPVQLMPRLTQLAREELTFTDKEAGILGGHHNPECTRWTMAALLATSSGVPFSIPVEQNVMNMYQDFAPGLTTFGDILARDGYVQEFLCGSDSEFGGRRNYFTQHGGYEIFDLFTARETGYVAPDYYVFWGYEDSYLYTIARDEATRLYETGKPFNLTFLTVDQHHWDGYVCSDCGTEYDEQAANVIACADRQAADFIDWCKQQPFYEDTVIVLVGDHPRMDEALVGDTPYYERTMYNAILNPQKTPAGETTHRVFTPMDMFPTMLSALGYDIEGSRLALGTDLFSGKPTLAEEIGYDRLNEECGSYSPWFVENICRPKETP